MEVVATLGPSGYRTEITAGGVGLIADVSKGHGGTGAGPAPYDYLLTALGACTAITLRMYAERKTMALASVTVRLSLVQNDAGPSIRRSLAIVGLSAEETARLAAVAERTPVTLSLKGGMSIETTVVEAST